jgi:hypothetical protein
MVLYVALQMLIPRYWTIFPTGESCNFFSCRFFSAFVTKSTRDLCFPFLTWSREILFQLAPPPAAAALLSQLHDIGAAFLEVIRRILLF